VLSYFLRNPDILKFNTETNNYIGLALLPSSAFELKIWFDALPTWIHRSALYIISTLRVVALIFSQDETYTQI